jgi:multidrug efflux system membrane fusion protein
LLIAAMIGGGAYALTSAQPKTQAVPAAASVPPVPVVAEPVKSGAVPIYLRGIGTVQAYNTDTIRTQVQGQLTQVNFKEGQAVHAGDLLAQIDPRPFQAQLDQAIANRQRDQAQLVNAQANLQRDSQLLAHGYATPQTVDLDKANTGQFSAAVKADEAAIEYAQTQLAYTRITSPINGVTGIRLIDVGNIVHPTDPNGLVVVTQLQPISVIFTLPETSLPQIQQAMAKGPLTVLAYSEDNKTKLDQGTLTVLDNQIIRPAVRQAQGDFPNPHIALAGRARQCPIADRDSAKRTDGRRPSRAAGSAGQLRLCDQARWDGREPDRPGGAARCPPRGHRFWPSGE